jgi:hypothetical protein
MTLRTARRIAIIAIIVSLSLTALIGIITLLSGDFGETQGKVLLTTLILAGFSITVLCHLAVVGRALRVVGFVGFAVSAVALVAGLILIWSDLSDSEGVWKTFGVFGILSFSFAHANLLLLLGQRRNTVVRALLYTTVAIIGVVALMICLPILTDGDIPGSNGDWYWRLLGVVAILDVLGTIVLPITGRFLRNEKIIRLELELTEELDVRLTAAAAGGSREAAALAALDRGL